MKENFETHRCRGCSGSPSLILERKMASPLADTLKQKLFERLMKEDELTIINLWYKNINKKNNTWVIRRRIIKRKKKCKGKCISPMHLHATSLYYLCNMQKKKKKKRERGRGKRDRRNIPFNFSLFAYIFLILSFQRNQLVIIPGRLRYTLAYNAFRRNVLISHNTITLNFSNDPSSHK